MGAAWNDIVDGVRYRDYWWTMGWNDIQARYRRSKLGQFWITLSIALFVASIGIVYAGIFGIPVADYIPRLTAGYVIWTFISSVMMGGCLTFISATGTMQQRRLPLSVHAYRLVARELLILAHNSVVIIGVWIIFSVALTPVALLAIPGLLLNAYIGFWIAIALGVICTRYRDIPPIVQSLLMLLFFVTPVLWSAEGMGERAQLMVGLNPFAHLVSVFRDPLLGITPPLSTWALACGFAVVVTILGLGAMALTRRRLAYWL